MCHPPRINTTLLDAIELALADYEALCGHPLHGHSQADSDMGELLVVVTIVTDNGGPLRFEAFIATHPELTHMRTRVRLPGQNGSRERGFGSLKYNALVLDRVDDAIELVGSVEAYRCDYNTTWPHEALDWNRPADVHHGRATPEIPLFTNRTLPTP